MSYRETRRKCPTCGRVTLHWLPRPDMRPGSAPEGWRESLASFFRGVLGTDAGAWRCLECDHPWNSTLLRK